MSVLPSPNWYRAVNDILDAAAANRDYEDFKQECRLQPATEVGYLTRMDILKDFIHLKNIEIINGKLHRLDFVPSPENLLSGISQGCLMGEAHAWEIIEKLQPNSDKRKKFNKDLLEQIGLEGELHVLEKLKENLPESIHKDIEHVSLRDDSLGYDILGKSVLDSNRETLLEVKTFSGHAGSKFMFYISKNEISIADLSQDWYLVAVERKNSTLSILGHMRLDRFVDAIPINNPPTATLEGSWHNTQIKIDKNLFIEGLP